MKPIKLYFAAAWTGQGCDEEERNLGVKNRLVSYLYPEQLETWLKITEGLPGNIIVDSGAFSAWNKGRVIDLDEYIKYAHAAIENGRNKTVRIVNLDVIPGKKGETARLNKVLASQKTIEQNRSLIEAAAKQGFMNLKELKYNGITPIHVYHQGEHLKWLDRMVEETDYIGISPANDMPNTSKKAWITSVFEYLYKHNINVDTHGFAVWIPDLLKDLPWTSCDAATWRLVAAWGGIYYPNCGFTHIDFSKGSKSFAILPISERRSMKGLGVLTPQRLKMLERDGYTYDQLQTWDGRARINIRFFLELEKWLNEYKEEREYSTEKKLKTLF